jgi:hypothetical protein
MVVKRGVPCSSTDPYGNFLPFELLSMYLTCSICFVVQVLLDNLNQLQAHSSIRAFVVYTQMTWVLPLNPDFSRYFCFVGSPGLEATADEMLRQIS